jgi:flavin-binding protein dodecin
MQNTIRQTVDEAINDARESYNHLNTTPTVVRIDGQGYMAVNAALNVQMEYGFDKVQTLGHVDAGEYKAY